LKKSCEGQAPGLGYGPACVNLSKIYKRGSEKLGIFKDLELSQEYDHKAFLCTPAGKRSIAMQNMPAAGQLIKS